MMKRLNVTYNRILQAKDRRNRLITLSSVKSNGNIEYEVTTSHDLIMLFPDLESARAEYENRIKDSDQY